MKLFIEPMDVWLFRNNKPFDAGSEHQAASLFPPSPQVLAGVIRSHHLVINDVDLRRPDREKIKQLVGTAVKPPEGFRLRGPVVARREQSRIVRYYPLPADAIWLKQEGAVASYQARQPAGYAKGPRTNLPDGLQLLWRRPYDLSKGQAIPGGVWLTEDDLQTYLVQGAVPTQNVIPGSELFTTEMRLGIHRDDITRASKSEMLYEVGFIRLREQVGLMVEVEGLAGLDQWPETGVFSIGGENRAARFCRLTEDKIAPWPRQEMTSQCRFKIYFFTPACFNEGWRPTTWADWFKAPPRLVGAALSRPQLLGGHDLAEGRPKPARRYIPAGAVYFFEGQPELKANQTTLTTHGATLGFGQFMIGRW